MKYKEDFVDQLVKFYKQSLSAIRGIELSKNVEGITHSNLLSFASYSPWLDDKDFLGIYNLIKGHTLVDIFRCYELYSWVTKNSHVPGHILEVGVWKGGTGCLLASALNRVDPQARIFLADTFKGVVKAGAKDSLYQGGEHADTTREIVERLIEQAGCMHVQILSGVYPDEIQLREDSGFRLCHIDVDTYQSAKDIFDHVWPSISKGGVVIFDDYGFWGCEGVTRLCNELIVPDGIFIYNLNGHALLIKL
jgi:O-methyltransferase